MCLQIFLCNEFGVALEANALFHFRLRRLVPFDGTEDNIGRVLRQEVANLLVRQRDVDQHVLGAVGPVAAVGDWAHFDRIVAEVFCLKNSEQLGIIFCL